MDNLCACGCGELAGVYTRTNGKPGQIQGQPRRFIHTHHSRGRLHHNWQGGVYIDAAGYVKSKDRSHSRADVRGYVRDHIVIAEHALGRALPAQAVVHHVDGNESNNKNSNLVICQDNIYHGLIHKRMRAYLATGNVSSVKCVYCKRWGTIGEAGMDRQPYSGGPYHLICRRADARARYALKHKALGAGT